MTPPSNPLSLPPEDIAIVGMACIFPGADTLTRYWENIVQKVDCITDAPSDWQADLFYDPQGKNPEKSYTQRGGFLGKLSRFNSLKYGVPPKDIEGAEPDQFLALKCAYDALTDAGYPGVPLNRDKTGVIVGRGIFINRGIIGAFQRLMAIDEILDVLRKLEPWRGEADFELIRSELRRDLPPFNADSFPGLVHSALVGRIANRLDLHGPAYTLDAACASVSLAMEQGVRELRGGSCDAVIVGGSQVSIPASIQIGFCTVEALSRRGKVAPFSADAAGTLLGQGCGMIVLKRRNDAVRDGNRIYALVKGVGSSSDGKGAGILAPLTSGQQLALRRAYQEAAVAPETIELLEAHGTGIPMGDATEMTTLRAVFGDRQGNEPTIALGSVKSMLGHLVPASGAASIIKTALALYHRVLPPTLHAETPHPQLQLDKSPFYLASDVRPWLHGRTDAPRRAGVNAFGFGGINAHVILEEDDADETRLTVSEQNWPAELVVISSTDRDSLTAKMGRLRSWLSQGKQLKLLDVAATCAQDAGICRLAIVASSIEDLVRKLEHAIRLLAEPTRDRIQDRQGVYWYSNPLAREGRIAFVFPGEGAQYVNMHADVCRHFPEVRQQFDLTDQAYRRWCGTSLASTLFPQPSQIAAAERRLLHMETAVAAVTASARGMLYLLRELGVRSDAVVGHSSGEFAAVLASGAFEPRNNEELIASIVEGIKSTSQVARCELIPRAVLLAVGGADPTAVREVLDRSAGRLVLAMDNCPHQMVLVGDEESATEALTALQGKGGLCQRIPWDRPYHTEAATPICKFVEEYVRALPLQSQQVELWSCVTAAPFPRESDAIKELGVRQWRSRVRFRETILAMHAAHCRVFVEVGPRGNLSAFVADTLAGTPHAAIALDVPNQNGVIQLCRAIGMLVAHGAPVRLEKLFQRRQPRFHDFNNTPPAPAKLDPHLRLDLPIVSLSDETAAKLRQPLTADPSPGIPEQPVTPAQSVESILRPALRPVPISPVVAMPPASPGEPAAEGQALATSFIPCGEMQASRTTVMVDFQETMRQFLSTQQSVMEARTNRAKPLIRGTETHSARSPGRTIASPAARSVTATANGSSKSHSPAASPLKNGRPKPVTADLAVNEPRSGRRLRFIQDILELTDDHLLAECEFDLDRDLFLLDHAFFGRSISQRDHSLHALPVMPLAMMLEVLAQAAVKLRPKLRVQAIHEIKCSRWLTFETRTRRVRITAQVETPVLVRVVLYEGDTDGMDKELVAGLVELADEPATANPAALTDASHEPPPWRPDQIYGSIVYHGPLFQGIEEVERWGTRGIHASIRTSIPSQLFCDGEAAELLLPVQLIDTASQLPGLVYTNHQQIGSTCRLTFPTYVERLEVAEIPQTPLTGIAVYQERDHRLDSDVEIRTGSGHAVIRYLGRTEEGIDIPLPLYRYAFEPEKVWLCRDITLLFGDFPGIQRLRVTATGDETCPFYLQRMWREVLARMILSRAEREEFGRKKLPPGPLVSWLLGRAAAKDAVRLHEGLTLCMADVDISADASGKPLVVHSQDGTRVSLAHKENYAVAAAGSSKDWAGIGIDTECIRPLDGGVREDAFTEAERRICQATPDKVLAEAIAWAAKEAIGKALGTGIPGSMRSIEIERMEWEQRTCFALVGADKAREFGLSHSQSHKFQVLWNCYFDHVIALCLVPAIAP